MNKIRPVVPLAGNPARKPNERSKLRMDVFPDFRNVSVRCPLSSMLMFALPPAFRGKKDSYEVIQDSRVSACYPANFDTIGEVLRKVWDLREPSQERSKMLPVPWSQERP